MSLLGCNQFSHLFLTSWAEGTATEINFPLEEMASWRWASHPCPVPGTPCSLPLSGQCLHLSPVFITLHCASQALPTVPLLGLPASKWWRRPPRITTRLQVTEARGENDCLEGELYGIAPLSPRPPNIQESSNPGLATPGCHPKCVYSEVTAALILQFVALRRDVSV